MTHPIPKGLLTGLSVGLILFAGVLMGLRQAARFTPAALQAAVVDLAGGVKSLAEGQTNLIIVVKDLEDRVQELERNDQEHGRRTKGYSEIKEIPCSSRRLPSTPRSVITTGTSPLSRDGNVRFASGSTLPSCPSVPTVPPRRKQLPEPSSVSVALAPRLASALSTQKFP